MNDFDDLKQWLTQQKRPKAALITDHEKRQAANKATHAQLDRTETLDDALARMLELLEWKDIELVCLRIIQECKCGCTESYTAGVFVKQTHPHKPGYKLVPLKFFPERELPRRIEVQTLHLDSCSNCFVEQEEPLIDALLAQFTGINGHDLVQLPLFAELPQIKAH